MPPDKMGSHNLTFLPGIPLARDVPGPVTEARVFQSHVIEVAGTFVGAAIAYTGKFRFVAVDPRLKPLDRSEWRTLADVHRVVRHFLTTGTIPTPSKFPMPAISAATSQTAIERKKR